MTAAALEKHPKITKSSGSISIEFRKENSFRSKVIVYEIVLLYDKDVFLFGEVLGIIIFLLQIIIIIITPTTTTTTTATTTIITDSVILLSVGTVTSTTVSSSNNCANYY